MFVTEHAREALELSKMQESTRQQEYQVKVKEYEAHIEQSKVEQKRIDHEERRKTLIVSAASHILFIHWLQHCFNISFRKRQNNNNNVLNTKIN